MDVTGEDVLRDFAVKAEQIEPDDRFRPLCRSLLALIGYVLPVHSAVGLDQDIIDELD